NGGCCLVCFTTLGPLWSSSCDDCWDAHRCGCCIPGHVHAGYEQPVGLRHGTADYSRPCARHDLRAVRCLRCGNVPDPYSLYGRIVGVPDVFHPGCWFHSDDRFESRGNRGWLPMVDRGCVDCCLPGGDPCYFVRQGGPHCGPGRRHALKQSLTRVAARWDAFAASDRAAFCYLFQYSAVPIQITQQWLVRIEPRCGFEEE